MKVNESETFAKTKSRANSKPVGPLILFLDL